jgi:hypothetical protein
MYNFNAEIETLLNDKNKGLGVPVSFMFYDGNATTYVTYMQLDKDNTEAGDDTILGCVQYYDFDIYSKSNYLSVVANLIEIMTAAGWTYQPSRDSPDMYERDTKYYHKTICLAKESEG